ncbi:MAG: 5-formyltetrahydrofolate cyclo-ligase [Mycobacteriales bacterium]|nr:5-formyltetrahydrofolate cyclo-ligase [Frankia sp.]
MPGDRAKHALRQAVLARRATIAAAQRAAAGAAITDLVLALPELAPVRVVAAYWALASEVPTEPLLGALVARGFDVRLPVLAGDGSLAWSRYAGADHLEPGPRGTSVPTGPRESILDADVVIAPGLAFDAAGRRLGRGGGSYDRVLAALPATTVTIGLAYDEDVLDAVPVAAHDRPVAIVLTPTRVLRAPGSA